MSTSNKNRTGGVLPINAAATKKPANAQKTSQRAPAPKLRLIIRRLPPGLTEAEFWDALGTAWQPGQGSVDWFAFKIGKLSKDPSKPSRPTRAYLKVKDQSLIEALSIKLKSIQFKDARNTANDSCLIGPPSLEFAPYNKTPSGRIRNDGRQGTIDQDPEFIDFLQSLTEPITKPTTGSGESNENKVEKVITTPLVQFIKEKKANKAKEKEAAAAAKTAKKIQEGKEGKGKSKGETKPTVIVKSSATAKTAPTEKTTNNAQPKVTNTKNEQKAKEQHTPAATTPKRERERGNASTAVKMISRDLGLTPKEPRVSRVSKVSNASGAVPTEPKANPKSSGPAPTDTNSSKSPVTAGNVSVPTPTGPRNKPGNQVQQPKQTQSTPQRQQKSSVQPNAGSKSAFLKHANPSQGVTEDLLRAAFTEFGEITRCEIDKKKGLAYIDFTEAESLKKAMSASPVKVANGQVVVLENRSPYRKMTQQRGGNDSASTPQSQTPTSAQPTDTALITPASKTEPTIETSGREDSPSTVTIPSDPSTASRGGRGGAKGPRGGKANQNAEGNKAVSGNRGGGGGGGRGGGGGGGKGNRGRGGKGGANAQAKPAEPNNQQ